MSSMRTSPKQLASQPGFFDHSTSPRPARLKRHTRPAQVRIYWSQTQFTTIWCTGKDSNLRTSQGGADLQSAGFNHSPTCAEIPGPVRSLHRHEYAIIDCDLPLGIRKCAKEYVRANNSSGKFPYGVPMEKLPAARLQIFRSESKLRNSEIISGAGEGI